MAKTIVFILSSAVNQNGIKRIDEFCSRGYKTCAYGFKRDTEIDNKPHNIPVHIVGRFSNNMPYLKRIGIMKKGISEIIHKTKEEPCIYYVIGTDVALVYKLITNRPYIYEEPDLVHTYIKYRIIRNALEWIDRRLIKKSLLTVFRSEGFINYHFGQHPPKNVTFIANRLNPSITDYSIKKKEVPDLSHIRFGFVGGLRFKSIFNFAKVVVESFPQHEFHFYGTTLNAVQARQFKQLERYENCYFHGIFHNPSDLPEIYGNIDLVLSTYDVEFDNVKFAEPNKIYEAIYFETPIIVSRGTFLGNKVERLGIGYTIDALNDQEVVAFVNKLTMDSISEKICNIQRIDKKETLNINDDFFEIINRIL